MTTSTSADSGTAIVTVLGWAFIVLGVIGLPISLISGAMVITRSHGTQNADAAGIFTVVLGPAAVLVCGIGLLRHWSWAWWGAVLMSLLVCIFGLRDFLKTPAPSFTYIAETGTKTTVMSSGGGLAALVPALLSGGLLALLLLPSVREHFSPAKSRAAAAASAAVEPGGTLAAPDAKSAAIQQEILAALRAGAQFSTAHKEGGTIIRWQHGRFIRQDYGDWNERAEFTGEAEFLSFLWRFFEWEGRNDDRAEFPSHKRWRNIQRLLWREDLRDASGTHGLQKSGPSWLWKPAAFVIAAAAVAFTVWLRGGIQWRGLYKEPTPHKLDTIPSPPPDMPTPKFKIPRTVDLK